MHPAVVIPAALGALAVLQAGLNQRIGGTIGLLPAAILNAGIFLAVAVLVWATVRATPGWTSGSATFAAFSWWWLVPGVCGLMIVLGLPWAIERVGALQAFIWLVAAQMVFSLVWDHFAEGVALSAQRVIGASLAILGAVITGWRT